MMLIFRSLSQAIWFMLKCWIMILRRTMHDTALLHTEKFSERTVQTVSFTENSGNVWSRSTFRRVCRPPRESVFFGSKIEALRFAVNKIAYTSTWLINLDYCLLTIKLLTHHCVLKLLDLSKNGRRSCSIVRISFPCKVLAQ